MKPERAKEMYTRQAAEEEANRIAATPDQVERAEKIGQEMRKLMHGQEQRFAPSSAPAEGGSNSAHLQKQSGQEKAQAELSPSDAAAGKAASQERREPQEKAAKREPQTIPRRPPSWER